MRQDVSVLANNGRYGTFFFEQVRGRCGLPEAEWTLAPGVNFYRHPVCSLHGARFYSFVPQGECLLVSYIISEREASGNSNNQKVLKQVWLKTSAVPHGICALMPRRW